MKLPGSVLVVCCASEMEWNVQRLFDRVKLTLGLE